MSDPAAAKSHFESGVRHWQAGALAEAVASFEDALRLDPQLAPAHVNLGLIREHGGALDAATAHYRAAIAIDPALFQAQLNLGVVLAAQKSFREAEVAYLAALAIDPLAAAAWSNLGVLYASTWREAQAEQCYRQALEIDPAYARARFNLAYVLLRQGRYEEGWAAMEARDWADALAPRLACPRWHGEAPAGRALLIVHEGGHGDLIQFCRYAAVLKTMGARQIGIVCPPALTRLLAHQAVFDAVFALDAELPASGWDAWVPFLSLPHLCGTRVDHLPDTLPYLRPDANEVARWGARIAAGAGLRVGLVWKGSTGFENDADRSLPSLATLAPLAAVPGVQWFSLQVGAGQDEARQPPPGMTITPLSDGFTDFADTAAALMHLDLVIAVDTAVAHLAGALGRPCWVLLPAYKPDWRWLAGRTDSPWYPGVMRLFWQARMGDWAPVVQALAQALGERVAQTPG